MPNIMKGVSKLVHLDRPSDCNLFSIIFVIVITISIIILKYPASAISHIFNGILGKIIIIFLIILLTSYNTLIGLIATIMIISTYIYLQKNTYEEGFSVIPPYAPLSRSSPETLEIVPDGSGKSKNSINTYTPSMPDIVKNDITSANGKSTVKLEQQKIRITKVVNPDISQNIRRNERVDKISAEQTVHSKMSNTLPYPTFKIHNEPMSNWPDKNGFSAINSGIDNY
jgi:hypothetical protein